MKKVSLIGLLLAALTFSACHRCQNFTRVEQAPIIKKYFGNYKPGAYWIYLNRDSTKRDSVWISNYTLTTYKDRLEQCMEMEERQFVLNSSYIKGGVFIRGRVGPDGNGGFQHTVANISYSFIANNNDSSFVKGDTAYWPIIKNYVLWQNTDRNPVIIIEGIHVSDYFLAPDTGIVQYVFPAGVDTFSLVKFYKP